MTRFVFDIHDGGSRCGEVGTACADRDAARMQAVQPLPDIAREEIPQDGDRRTFTVLVTDEDERPVYSTALTYAGSCVLR